MLPRHITHTCTKIKFDFKTFFGKYFAFWSDFWFTCGLDPARMEPIKSDLTVRHFQVPRVCPLPEVICLCAACHLDCQSPPRCTLRTTCILHDPDFPRDLAVLCMPIPSRLILMISTMRSFILPFVSATYLFSIFLYFVDYVSKN